MSGFDPKNKIWNKAARANEYSKLAFAIGQKAKGHVDENFKTAKRSGVTAKVAKVKFSGKNKGKVTGQKTITRSAYGETPAIATGQLSKGTKVRRKAAFSVIVYNDVKHGKHLEPPAKLNRPFLLKPILAHKAEYVEMARQATRRMT